MIKFAQNSVLFLLSIIIGLVVIEGILRVSDPFDMRISANTIKLPVGRVYKFTNSTNLEGVDQDVVHRKNKLGFRGEDWPQDPDVREKWFFVGGSTTESFYFNDEDTWVDLVYQHQKKRRPNLWVNNAGLDGHTSFGHTVLTKDFLINIKPQKIFYLVGINDIGYDAPKTYDARLHSDRLGDWFSQSTEIGKLITLYKRARKAKIFDLVHDFSGNWNTRLVDATGSQPDPETLAAELAKHKSRFIPGYKRRIEELIALTQNNGIEPVLITQPALLGATKDPTTGLYLGGENESVRWAVLEEYNNVLRTVAKERNVAFIELAQNLPKDTALYYDRIHYNKAGQIAVSDIINRQLDKLYPVQK